MNKRKWIQYNHLIVKGMDPQKITDFERHALMELVGGEIHFNSWIKLVKLFAYSYGMSYSTLWRVAKYLDDIN